MPKIIVLFAAAILLATISVSGCSGDIGATSAGPKAGQSAISLQLSGGHLADPLEFSGTVDKTLYIGSSSMSFLGSGLDFTGSNGTAVLQQMIVDLNSLEAGTYPAKEQDVDMVFHFPTADIGYSMQPRESAGTIKIERLGGEHVRIHFDFDASPSNIGSKSVVFHVKGVLESRPRD